MTGSGAISTWAHRVDKMSGVPKEWKRFYGTNARRVIKRYTNAKRRRYLKFIQDGQSSTGD